MTNLIASTNGTMTSNTNGKTFLIVGGRSPIAIASSLKLAETSDVIHVTRTKSADLRKIFNGSRVRLIEQDLSDPLAATKIADKAPKHLSEISGIAFLQRFRTESGQPSFENHMRVEVWSPVELLRYIASERKSNVALTAVIASSPAAQSVVSDQSLDYHIVKSAQESSFRYLARELSAQSIECISVRIGSLVIKERASNYWNQRESLRRVLGDLGSAQGVPSAETIGRQIANILANGPLGISGQTIVLDGGLGLADGPQAAKNSIEAFEALDKGHAL